MAKEKIELGPTGRTVAKNLRRIRAAQELSLKELAELADGAGRRFGVNALSQAEKGLRRLDIDDVAVLALVLGVNVNALMLPVEIDREQPVEITTTHTAKAEQAWNWATGRSPLPGMSHQLGSDFRPHVLPWWLRDRFNAADTNEMKSKLLPSSGFASAEQTRTGRKQPKGGAADK